MVQLRLQPLTNKQIPSKNLWCIYSKHKIAGGNVTFVELITQ